MGTKRTAWHFYFCILLRRHAPRSFEVRDEVPLSDEPPRMDFLLLRRSGDPSPTDAGETLIDLWPRLPRVTIAELKTTARPYEKGNLDRLWMYCHAYYAAHHRTLAHRNHLGGLLLVPRRTPSLDQDTAEMKLTWTNLGGGYWQLHGGLFPLLVTELDQVAGQPGEDLLGLFTRQEMSSRRAAQLWQELVGSEATMEARELEGYEDIIQKILAAIPSEQRLAGLAPEQRLAGLAPEQRLAGLAPEQAVLALPVEVLRALSAEYLATLPEATRAEIARRLGRS